MHVWYYGVALDLDQNTLGSDPNTAAYFPGGPVQVTLAPDLSVLVRRIG